MSEKEINLGDKFFLYILIGFIVFILFLFINPFKLIGAGENAIVFNRFTNKISVLDTGLRWVTPIVNYTKIYSIRITKTEYKKICGLSSDSQTLDLDFIINWSLDSHKLDYIFRNIKGDIEDTIMYNAVVDTSKAELGKFRIDDIAKNREKLRQAVQNALFERLKEKGVVIHNVSVTNVDFNDEYEGAIENKMIAEQQALEAKNLKEKVKYESEAKKIENQNLSSVTPLVLKQKWIEKWDGKLPQVMTAENANMLLNYGGANQ